MNMYVKYKLVVKNYVLIIETLELIVLCVLLYTNIRKRNTNKTRLCFSFLQQNVRIGHGPEDTRF